MRKNIKDLLSGFRSGASGSIAAHETDNGSVSNGTPWWTGENVSGWADAFGTVWDSVHGNSQPDAVIIQQTAPPTEETQRPKMGWIIGLVLGLVFLIVLILLLKRKK